MAARQIVSDLNETPTSNRMPVINTIPALMVLLSVLLAFGLLMLIFSIVQGLHLGNMLVHPNPFTSYEALWPGQPIASVLEFEQRTGQNDSLPCYSAVSQSESYVGTSVNLAYSSLASLHKRAVCITQPGDGIFHSMSITVDGNRVQELNLFSDTLQQDTLLLFWGIPDAVSRGRNGRNLYLHWNAGTYSATAMIAQPGTAVNLVTLIAKQ